MQNASNAAFPTCTAQTNSSPTPDRAIPLRRPTERFRSAVQDAKIGPGKDIPHVTPEVIVKYLTDLQLLVL